MHFWTEGFQNKSKCYILVAKYAYILCIMQLNFSIHVDLCEPHVSCVLIKPLMLEKPN